MSTLLPRRPSSANRHCCSWYTHVHVLHAIRRTCTGALSDRAFAAPPEYAGDGRWWLGRSPRELQSNKNTSLVNLSAHPTRFNFQNFMKCLMRMHAQSNHGVIFFETITSFKSQRHSYIEAIPVPFWHIPRSSCLFPWIDSFFWRRMDATQEVNWFLLETRWL